MDPATGLCFMRDRWYDPQTGTFLTPDRAGHHDSSNLYVFGKGDPVNNSDPTGMTVALWGTPRQKDAAYKRLVGTLDNPAAIAHLTIDKQYRIAVTGISVDDFIERYDGRARQLGQMIDSPKTVYLTEVRSTTPITSPFNRNELLQDKIEHAGGGFFDTFDHAHGLAAFNPELFPREVADVTETSDATFVHEFFGHAYAWAVPYGATEAQTGTIPQKYVYNVFTGGIGAGEADGLWAENTYRLQHQMRLRTYYLRARDDWNAPAWLAPSIQRQRQADVLRADEEAERRRQQLLQHNIWHWPGLR
ncbi:MAG TPA: RHS repeat-associated core domain-containing protein [Thermoanaerobaculia bacterium]|nr:RHS repeat-associated core domain-containing protein [Thermoanaerobaculia bacterium]